MPPHLLVALTPHGFGHAAMTAPVVDELRRRLPQLRLTLQTAIPRTWLASRYREPFELIPEFPIRPADAVRHGGSAPGYLARLQVVA